MIEQSPEVLRFYHFKELACDATIAAMFLILYDTVLTMGQEIDLVWRSAWSPPKFVYIMNRYSSILFATSYLLG
ncbi:hypothetical protein QCA50_001397 [Cerrena zonata]|uniref:DUF6533 domain-containing protein n=1 Tax=Cerrena zonata TaxID=2478898 RepID=A0AAW0GQL2_9APHY